MLLPCVLCSFDRKQGFNIYTCMLLSGRKTTKPCIHRNIILCSISLLSTHIYHQRIIPSRIRKIRMIRICLGLLYKWVFLTDANHPMKSLRSDAMMNAKNMTSWSSFPLVYVVFAFLNCSIVFNRLFAT